jgi:hypothetical protein
MRHVTALAHDLMQLMFIWNALKTSRKVLGNDMPMAEEAQQYETAVERVLMDGLEGADKARWREGKELKNSFVGYVREGVEKCRS